MPLNNTEAYIELSFEIDDTTFNYKDLQDRAGLRTARYLQLGVFSYSRNSTCDCGEIGRIATGTGHDEE